VHVRATRTVALLRDAVGYVFLANFSGSSAEEVRQGVDSLRALGARSVVLDLRGNPGGLLDQGVSVADLFLGPGQPIVRIEGRTPETKHASPTARRSRGRRCPSCCSSTRGARAPRRSSPARCRTTTARSWGGRPTGRGARRAWCRCPTARR
jgi:hypothetical protein